MRTWRARGSDRGALRVDQLGEALPRLGSALGHAGGHRHRRILRVLEPRVAAHERLAVGRVLERQGVVHRTVAEARDVVVERADDALLRDDLEVLAEEFVASPVLGDVDVAPSAADPMVVLDHFGPVLPRPPPLGDERRIGHHLPHEAARRIEDAFEAALALLLVAEDRDRADLSGLDGHRATLLVRAAAHGRRRRDRPSVRRMGAWVTSEGVAAAGWPRSAG